MRTEQKSMRWWWDMYPEFSGRQARQARQAVMPVGSASERKEAANLI